MPNPSHRAEPRALDALPSLGSRICGRWFALECTDLTDDPPPMYAAGACHLLAVSLPMAGRRAWRAPAEAALAPGTAAFIPAGEVRAVALGGPCHLVNIAFEDSALVQALRRAGVAQAPRGFVGQHDPVLAGLADAMRAALQWRRQANEASVAMFDALARAAVARIAVGIAPDVPAAAPVSAAPLSAPELERVLAHIEARLEDADLSVAALAAFAGMPVVRFHRAFRAATGQPPHRYVITERVKRVKALMLEGRLPLAEIALACGFASQSHMNDRFRDATGMPPGAWRSRSAVVVD